MCRHGCVAVCGLFGDIPQFGVAKMVGGMGSMGCIAWGENCPAVQVSSGQGAGEGGADLSWMKARRQTPELPKVNPTEE